jgi:ABC-type dipeptide/oligopeptide/nickel transport system permease subunit
MIDARARLRFRKNRAALVGAGIVLTLLVFALVVPLVSARDPLASDFVHGVSPSMMPVGPSALFPFGVDRLFRDELTRLAYGARLSLVIAFAATSIASTIGAVVGILAGYYEGTEGVRVAWCVAASLVLGIALVIAGRPGVAAAIVVLGVMIRVVAQFTSADLLKRGPRVNADGALMRLVDVGLSFPFLLLIIAIGAALDETSARTILVTLGLTGWLGTARIVRAKTMQIRNLDFVLASRALGQNTPRILVRHVLPNVAGPLVVIATVSVAQMIIAESVLSYLGAGISPPTPTWGRMLFEGWDYIQAAPWLVIAPGGAILLAVFGFNLLGEGLRDALDPKEG